ncbi:37 kDa salivary gland allergen Aed a 2-like isoform X2 [Toxorhynchites rutilus septentrionalis]|uniref:37 kDa salivary gland allergen Aed a 2-like isoform X2 n=1 Tax=Toxorhynchites rutilus septentrionalis TaxID=329112 RepID=UPI00247A0585|nr:37 kDa salivary gland allergen Aed a 2-like isoform X2 [Toxorhynchites rutilus septentrionalis]
MVFCAVGALLLLLVHLQPTRGNTNGAFDPEETLFAFTRCIEDYASKGSTPEPGGRVERIERWMSWELHPAAGDQQTRCFVHCLLSRLELLVPLEGNFRAKRLLSQYERYGSYVNCSRIEVEMIAKGLENRYELRDCDSVYEAFTESILPNITIFKQIFLLDPDVSAKVYLDSGALVRQQKQSYFQFCEQAIYSNKTDVWCAARNYTIPADEDFPRHINCIFRGLRYLNREGAIIDEVIRDFHVAGMTDLDSEITTYLNNCLSGPSDGVISYYKCLLESPFVEQFKEALDYREIRSSDYYYMLRHESPSYNRTEIQEAVNVIYETHCGKYISSAYR